MPAKHKPGTIRVLKNGTRAKVLPSGRLKFLKGPSKGHSRKKKRGGAAAVGGSARVAGAARVGGGGQRMLY